MAATVIAMLSTTAHSGRLAGGVQRRHGDARPSAGRTPAPTAACSAPPAAENDDDVAERAAAA